ncbi:hypothetical protein Bbelb_128530 [Branchiostoma belcheri]|nr:hypothetical protein Bbelb_128530 [Branchiostoma belcheri]
MRKHLTREERRSSLSRTAAAGKASQAREETRPRVDKHGLPGPSGGSHGTTPRSLRTPGEAGEVQVGGHAQPDTELAGAVCVVVWRNGRVLDSEPSGPGFES